MKKRLFAILVLAIVMILGFTSCEYVDIAKDFIEDKIDQILPPEETPPTEPEEFVVYFTAGEGIGIPSQAVKEGGLVTRPEDPYKEGYLFDNWYKDEAFTVVWDFATDTVVRNTIIYGKWNEHTHTGGTATCTEQAVCEVCGHAYGKLLDHVGGTATCTEAATCEACGKAYGNPLGHDVVTLESKAPTCTETGLTEGAYCTRCDAKVEQEVIPALGHADADEDYVCDRCDAALERPVVTTTIALDLTADNATSANGPQDIRIGDFDVILSSANSRIDASNKTFDLPDGSSVKKTHRINFNGSATMTPATSASGEWENAVKFVTSGKGTVTIYWVHAGKPDSTSASDLEKARRNVGLWDAEGNLIACTDEQFAKDELVVTTFEFDAAGTYYVGNLVHANYFFYVEVTYEGEKASLPSLAKYPVHFVTGEGSAIDSVEVEENCTIEKPADPTREGYDFAGWYKDEEYTTPWNFSTDKVTAETTLYAKWEESYTGEYKEATYSLNISDLETGTRSANEIKGKFTIVSGTEVRNRTKTYEGVEYQKSVKFGNNDHKILVDVPGTGTLSFLVQNGSSGVDMQFIKVIAPDGTVHDIEFVAGVESNPVVKIEVEVTEGIWTICRGKNGGTQDIFALELKCLVEDSPENGFELVATGNVDYVAGQDFSLSGLTLNATFSSGMTEPLTLSDVTVDSSAFNKDVAGEYTITISYKDYDPISYKVTVYAPSALELHFDAIEKLSQNSAAGNGVYYNHSWKEVYMVGENLDKAGLSVYVVASYGEKTLKFRVDDYEITGFDSSYADYCMLTVSAYGVDTTIEVHVTDTQPTPNADGTYMLLVDPDYEGLAGAISGSYHVFSTIQGALDYAANIDKSAVKELYIAPGLYREKLEITIPNLHIIGWGENPDDVVIEWDSLYGLVDGGGFTHTTDSTATVAIRDGATNVTIENVTISNYWNSQDRMTAAGLAIERGLALLVQADRFVMKNSRLLGIQDTLELFTGRQYFENVYISGYTDFIFGTNNTTYFKGCTIHVIDTEKDDKGTAGYITAFKGSNKGADDAIVYGAIFDGCKFTADAGVMEGKTAIGRPWGAYAAVAVINSELGGHISTEGFSTSKNERYVSMNAKPTDATVQFVEYNNTGAGAITEAVAGMRFLTAEEAAKYADFAIIFGTTNGKVTYLDPWNPESTEVVVDDREYYYFNGQEGTSGTSYTYTDNIQGAVGTLGNITIDATVGKLTHRGSDSQFNAGAKIIFNVPAGTLVTVISYPGYGHYTINGIAHNANDTFSVYFAEATEVVIEATATSYLYQLIINPGEEAPEAPTMTEVKVEGMVTDYLVGEEISLEGVTVNAHYSDFSVRPVEYTVDTSAVNNAVAGEYDVVFTVGGETITVKVTFVSDFAISESTTIDLSATGVKIEGKVDTYKGLTIDATSGKFADNNGGWTQVNAGTVITFNVVGEAEVSVTAYTSADNFDILIVDGLCTITATANDYLKAIIVKIKVVYGEDTTIDLSATGANIQKTTGVYQGLEVDATNGKFADNNGGWVQVNAGTVIKLNVLEGATVSVTAYTSADNFDIVIANGVCTITAVGNDYLKAITVTYPEEKIVFDEDTTIDLSATGVHFEGNTGVYEGLEIDATNGKFKDNNGGWTQVNAGTVIKLNVLDGAKVSVTAYTSADNFTVVVENGVCTITAVGNDYLKAITVAYPPAEPADTGLQLNFWVSNETLYVTNGNNIQYSGEGGSFACVGSDVSAHAAGKNTFTVTITNNGEAAARVRIDIQGTTQVGNHTVLNTSATGGDVWTDVEWGGSTVTVPAGESVTLVITYDEYTDRGAVTNLVVFVDSCKNGDTTTYNSNVTLSGMEFSGESVPPAPSVEYTYTDLYVEFKTENAYTITTADTYVNSARISYADIAKNSWNNINVWVADKSADCTVFSMKLTNHGEKSVSVWVQMKDADGAVLINQNVNIAAGTENVFTFEYTGTAQMIFFFVDSTHEAAEDLNSGDITISEIKLGKVAGEEEPEAPVDTVYDLTSVGVHFEGSVGEYNGLTIDATNGKFADNGNWTQVNTGTIITFNVSEGAVVSVTAYYSADNFTVVVADGVCTITATANDYLSQIKVEYTAVEEPETPEVTKIVHNFTSDEKNSEFFTINGNIATNKGTVIYNGEELTKCLKMESSTSVTFTTDTEMTLTLVVGGSDSKDNWVIKINGTNYTPEVVEDSESYRIVTLTLEAGSHEIKKSKTTNLYLIVLE